MSKRKERKTLLFVFIVEFLFKKSEEFLDCNNTLLILLSHLYIYYMFICQRCCQITDHGLKDLGKKLKHLKALQRVNLSFGS